MSREPWRPIFKNFRQQLIGKRIIAILFLCLWSGILGSWYIVIHRYANNFTEMCERINYDDNVVVETIQYNPGLSDWGRRFDGYRLVEYLLNGKGRQQQTDEEVMADRDAYDEIPILFVPDGEDAADAQQFLAKLLRDRTRGEKFRYRFFSIDFGNQLAFINGLHMDMMHQYVTRATVWIMNRYSHKRVVLIGHGTGGTAAHSTSTLFEWRYYEKMNLNVTDIMIFMAAPLGHPGFVQDRKTEKFYELNRNRWLEKRDFAQVGHLSISAGFADGQVTEEWTQFLDMINVPAWSIQDVPDVGTKAGGILVCKPILNHIADLLIEYGRQTNVKMGKQILNEFYADYWKQKETKLPLDWRNDTLDGALTMTTGGQYEFIMHDKQWLTVKLARGEFIVVTIYGSCLNSATIIRGLKYIRRKEESIIGQQFRFEFSVFNAKRFEDIRILLETDSKCHVSIVTNPTWLEFGFRLYWGFARDGHYSFVGGLVVAVYLVVLEGQRRSTKFEMQIDLLVFFGGLTIYQMVHTIGTSMSGFIFGGSMTLALFIATSSLDWFILRVFNRSADAVLPFLNEHFEVGLSVATLCTFVSSHWGFMIAYILVICSDRPVTWLPFLFPLAPLMTKTVMSATVFTADKEGFNYTHGWMICAVSLYFFLYTINYEFNRLVCHAITYYGLLVHMVVSYATLETHYGLAFLILLLNRCAVKHTPRMLKEHRGALNMEALEYEWNRLDSEN